MDEMILVLEITPVPLDIKILPKGKGILLCRGEPLADKSMVQVSNITQEEPHLKGIKEGSHALYIVLTKDCGVLRFIDRSIPVAELTGVQVWSISDAR